MTPNHEKAMGYQAQFQHAPEAREKKIHAKKTHTGHTHESPAFDEGLAPCLSKFRIIRSQHLIGILRSRLLRLTRLASIKTPMPHGQDFWSVSRLAAYHKSSCRIQSPGAQKTGSHRSSPNAICCLSGLTSCTGAPDLPWALCSPAALVLFRSWYFFFVFLFE
jgi:hypothetical protein